MKRIPIAAALAATAVAVAACNNDKLTSVNNNPNAPTDAPTPAIFTNAVQSAVGQWLGSGYDLRDLSLIIQHLAENQYVGNDQYKGVGPGSQNALFSNVYQNSLEDFQVVVRKGKAANDPSAWAPASIMQQWEYGYLTDTWGDVPYSQALAADSATPIVSPAYDPQQEIYNGMMAKLQAAAVALQGDTVSTLDAADPIYGSIKKDSLHNVAWQKFANSLHARDAMRIVNADQTKASAELQAAFNAPGGTFASNADNAILAWPGDGVFNNPWAVNFASRDDERMSKTLVDTLAHYNDPRLKIYAMPSDSTGLYTGQPNGLNNTQAGFYSNRASRPGAIFYPGTVPYGLIGNYGGSGNSYPSYLMTYAEVEFIKAEAAERGLGGLAAGTAAQHYYNGITASMKQWGAASDSAITAYLAQPSVAYQGGTAGLKQIALQKWIALYSDAGQAWAEWRRTCTPTLALAQNANFPYIPRRIKYPTVERSSNNAHVEEAAARMGGDLNSTRVWWDKAGAPTCP